MLAGMWQFQTTVPYQRGLDQFLENRSIFLISTFSKFYENLILKDSS